MKSRFGIQLCVAGLATACLVVGSWGFQGISGEPGGVPIWAALAFAVGGGLAGFALADFLRCRARRAENIHEQPKSYPSADSETRQVRIPALSDLSERLTLARLPRDVGKAVLEVADEVLGWDTCSLELASDDQSRVETVFGVDNVEGTRKEVAPGESVITANAQAVFEGGARLENAPLRVPGEAARSALPGTPRQASTMIAPIRKDGRRMGLLKLRRYRPPPYQPDHLRVLQALADLCANTLERIRAEGEIQRLNRQLRRHLEELQTVFDVAPVGLAVAEDIECRRLTGNPAYRTMMGGATEATNERGGPLFQVRRNGIEVPEDEQPMQQAARQGVGIPGQEFEFWLADGRVRRCYVAASPLFDDAGKVRGSLGVFVDLTQRKEAEAGLKERDERLRLALAAGKMGTWTYELRDQRHVFFSPELEALFGLEPGTFAGTEKAALACICQEDHPRILKAFFKAPREPSDYEVEFRFHRAGREPGWMLGRGRAYFGDNDQPVRVAGVCLDITARKEAEHSLLQLNLELERRVRDRTAQLEATNRELEAFSYSVSHDLRAPLRSIRGFGEVLAERYSVQLDEQGRDFLRRVRESCSQMDGLIDNLLELSRVGRSAMQPRRVDLSAAAMAIAAELRKSEPKRNVEFLIPLDLWAVCDERLIRVVLDNLLRNAWKFTQKQARPRIEFGYVTEPEPAFFVRDNGAGFDMAYADKLFGVFQRLHTAAEFPGNGVGLATVQRIINRHGGRTWATAVVNRGATFYFTLPNVLPATPKAARPSADTSLGAPP